MTSSHGAGSISPWSTPTKSEFQANEGLIDLFADLGLTEKDLDLPIRESGDGKADSAELEKDANETIENNETRVVASPKKSYKRSQADKTKRSLKSNRQTSKAILKDGDNNKAVKSRRTRSISQENGALPRVAIQTKKRNSLLPSLSSSLSSTSKTSSSSLSNVSTSTKLPQLVARQEPISLTPKVSSPDSPERSRSPSKSPFKRRKNYKDVIELARPYNDIKSDDVKRWDKELKKNGRLVDPKDVETAALVAGFSFCNALILKFNQLAKQGLLNRNVIFGVASHISHFDIPVKDAKKCANSFYSFARKMAVVREAMESKEQKESFDLKALRPQTAKPKDPDDHVFTDKSIEKDYKKLWDHFQKLQEEMGSESLNTHENQSTTKVSDAKLKQKSKKNPRKLLRKRLTQQ